MIAALAIFTLVLSHAGSSVRNDKYHTKSILLTEGGGVFVLFSRWLFVYDKV